MAVNSGGVYFILFGVYSFVSDPNSAILLDIVNELFFTNITHEQILEFIETWKTHLLSLMASGQTFMMWYQSIRVKMRNADKEGFVKFINEEIGNII